MAAIGSLAVGGYLVYTTYQDRKNAKTTSSQSASESQTQNALTASIPVFIVPNYGGSQATGGRVAGHHIGGSSPTLQTSPVSI